MKKNRLNMVHVLTVMLLMALPLVVQAQTVVLTTSRPVGENLSFTVNPGVISVDWGDGVIKTIQSTGTTIEGVVMGNSITIKGENFTSLECEGARLTDINLQDAKKLATLLCNNNELTSLTLPSGSSLRALNCSANDLNALTLVNARNLIYLNCAQNKLPLLAVSSCPNLETLICSDNMISALTLTSNAALQTLWCQNNSLTRLAINSNPNLVSVLADGNNISTLRTTSMAELLDFWCDNNAITEIDVSASTKLKTLSFENNAVTSLSVPSKTGMQGFYSTGSELCFSKLYSTKSTMNYAYGTDGYMTLPAEEVNVNENYDLSSERSDASGQSLATTYTWKKSDGTTLVAGSNADYRMSAGVCRFYKGFNEIYCYMTSDFFPGLTVRSSALRVMDPTSIENVTQRNGFTYSVVGNSLQMSADVTTKVQIHSIDGKLMWSGTVGNNGTSVQLQNGIYIVNGIKVLL